MKKVFVFTVMLMLVGGYVAGAADIEVAGTVDKNPARVDEEVALTIRILGAHGNIQAPRLPAFQGFDSFYTGRTSQFTFANGKSSSTVEFNYVLVPKVAGRFTLDPVEVWIEGKRYLTQPIQLEVTGPQLQALVPVPPSPQRPLTMQAPSGQTLPAAGPAQASGTMASPQIVHDDDLFVKATVDKTAAYPNEQIILTYTLFTRYDTRYEGFEEEASVSGFWIEDFPLDRDLGRDTVSVEGKRYVKADIRKIALFPTSPATYTIQPGVLKVSVREQPRTTSLFDDFFDDSFFSGAGLFARRVERLIKPEPIVIHVRPFPETGKPTSFNGAVGQFRLSASVDRNEVKQNEPVTLKLVVEGEGNIETLARPTVPQLTGFKTYEGDSSSELFKTGGNIGGRKTFEVIFIPTEAGEMAIPPLEFSFFDPRREVYQTHRSPSFPLRVTPSSEPLRLPEEVARKEVYKKEVKLEAQDIRYIHEEFPSDRAVRTQSFFYYGLLAANAIGLLAIGNGLLQRRREAIFSRDVALKRRKLARQTAERRLKGLRRLARSTRPEEADQFLGEAEKTLAEYLCNKFNAPAYQFTREWLEERLQETLGSDDSLLKEVGGFYDTAGEARYGRGLPPMEERRHFIRVIESVIRKMERVR